MRFNDYATFGMLSLVNVRHITLVFFSLRFPLLSLKFLFM